jgi:LacI family transcriptional regulator
MGAPTIKDVARQAGVDPSTVSRVLNNRLRKPVLPTTAERIRQAARELGYAPHASARALVLRRTHTIGLICFEISDPYFSALAQAVQSRLEAQGYLLIVCSANSQGEREAAYARLLSESRVDGVLVAGTTGVSPRVMRDLMKERSIPIVAAGPPLLPESSEVLTACAAHDHLRGGFLVGHHLGTLGHQRVGQTAVSGVSGHHGTLRLQGLQAGLAASGVRETVRLVDPVENTFEGGFHATRQLLAENPDLTAIFGHNDRMALGAIHALWELGRRVPESVSVVGYQDLPMAAHTLPPLTTVRIPVEQIACQATELLLQALTGAAIAEREVVIQPELVLRQSTAPPRT